MRRDLPSGTVTFVFTDVEGSTRLLEELGASAYGDVLDKHRRALRQAFAAYGGVEVDTQGDAFFYAFATAPAALAAAGAARSALEPGPIRIRMGIHTGTPHLATEGYVGIDVHRAARIAACGHGGQILVSASTAALAGAELVDLGEHRLKDLSAPERIFQLGTNAFPALRTLWRTNLPVPATPFVGRERDLAGVSALLSDRDTRLLTLTGAGGTGKTRLALQATAAGADEFPGGVWWVALAPLRDPALVLPSAAQALGASGPLAEHLRDARTLVLFDNFEHVLPAAGELAELVAACPELTVLVTSREPLRLSAEREYAVPPLDRDDAIAFFAARARAAGTALDGDEAVAEVCRRLDDLPLALELAAARTKVLSVEQILARIEQRLPLLTGGPRDLPERQRTLRATIEWSHDLLDEPERRLFARLAVFAGGCTLEAAEEVVGAELDVLQSLVEKSLVRRTGERYWMLESIREFALERLAEDGDADACRARHAAFQARRVAAAGLSLEPENVQDYPALRPELDNVRAALAWSLEHDPELGLRIAADLEGLWAVMDPNEGMRWFALLLERTPDAAPALRGRALRAYGGAANPAGDDALAERLYEESLAAFREAGDDHGAAVTIVRLGYSAFYRGDVERAGELGEETLRLNRAYGYRPGESQALGLLGEVAYARGDRDEGVELIARSADLAREAGFPWWRSRMLRKLVDCALDRGSNEEAEAWARESLRILAEIGDRQMTLFALVRLARIAAETGRPRRAGLLFGAIETDEARGGVGAWAKERERLAAPVLVHEGPEFEEGRQEGRALALDEAVALALAPAR